ncbi:MAG: RnfABCDGE type electron transport complex subunit D, partial [Treponema sp.]|nr:RnfABCDGE type electron transport complex subunit D [Treponema sp.]
MIQISSSPHISSGLKTRHVMWIVVFALLPETVWGVILFGIPALLTICASVATAVASEWLFNKITKKRQSAGDGSA